MNDEHADHAHHLLHRHVRVVEEGAMLVQRELVYEPAPGQDRVLCHAGHAVHRDGHLEAMPVRGEDLRQVVLDDEADPVSLVHLDRRAGHAPVEAPGVADARRAHVGRRHELGPNRLRDNVEGLDSVFHAPRHLRHIRRLDRNNPAARLPEAPGRLPRFPRCLRVRPVSVLSQRLAGCGEACGGHEALKKISSVESHLSRSPQLGAGGRTAPPKRGRAVNPGGNSREG